MSRIACAFLFTAAVAAGACSKATETAGAPVADLATPAGLTSTLTSKLGISESQANAAVGSVLGMAQTKLSPSDYAKLSGAIPGADNLLSAAADAGVMPSTGGAPSAEGAPTGETAAAPPAADSIAPIPGESADSAMAGAAEAPTGAADAVAGAAAGSIGMDALNSTFSKLGIPPEAATQFVPVLTDYVGKVGGPDAANILKGLF